MTELKLIDQNTDISALRMHKLDWDVVVCGVPYQVVRIDGYVHTLGGHWCENNFWCYPLGEEPSAENLAEFDAEDPVCWGITCAPRLYHRHKWGEHRINRTAGVCITRNGVPFDDGVWSVEEAQVRIEQYRFHPLDLDARGFEQKCLGRKVWWRSEPAVVTRYISGQACVILEPDGIDRFTIPPEFKKDDLYYEEREIKTRITDEHIWWFRDDDIRSEQPSAVLHQSPQP